MWREEKITNETEKDNENRRRKKERLNKEAKGRRKDTKKERRE